jgi:chaperone BCS1
MTTNHIEHLDEALIRPGRSDKKVHFKLADQNISTQLFNTVFKQSPNQKQCNEGYDDETIDGLARDFASKMPEQVYSPAEISFLLDRKKSPLDAVSCGESWVTKAKYWGEGREGAGRGQLKSEHLEGKIVKKVVLRECIFDGAN